MHVAFRACTLISISMLMAAASAASAAPVAASNMGAYCRSQAAKEFSARPSYVKSTRAMPAEDGSATVNGTYADGNGHTKAFTCRFDAQGNFVEVKAADTAKP